MASTYDIYKGYHDPKYTPAEEERLEQAKMEEQMLADLPPEMRTEEGYIDERPKLNPMTKFHVDIAIDRADRQLRGWDYPDDPTAADRYPGLDPKGKFSEVEMAFAQREANIKAALATRPPMIQAYVNNLMSRFTERDEYDQVYCLRRDMQSESQMIREHERAAKLCMDPLGSKKLEEEAARRSREAYQIKEYDKFVSALEYITGIHDKTPSYTAFKQTVKKGMYDEGSYIPQEILDLREAPDIPPASLTVEFANFDNQMTQRYFTNPRNWGKTPKDVPQDVSPDRQAALEPVITRYAAVTADRSLDAVFGKKEKMLEGEKLNPRGINRATLTIVGGKTVAELMQEDYSRIRGEKPEYEEWFQKNARRMTAEKVSAGLMAGERVETFIPDAKGRIPKEPTQITKSGYEPSPLKKVTLNAWERHFAKHGFYKEKAARAEAYQQQMAARERVAMQNEMAQKESINAVLPRVKKMFFEENIPTEDMGHFRVTRSAAVNTCVCYMAAKGYPVEDIMDPTKLQAERLEAGRTYLDAARRGDDQWLGTTICQGQQALMGYMEKFPHDLSDPKVFRENVHTLSFVADAMFDSCQEKDSEAVHIHYIREMEKTAGGRGYEASKQLDERCGNLGSYIRFLNDGTKAALRLSSPEILTMRDGDLQSSMASVLRSELLRKEYAAATKADPQSHIADRQSQNMSGMVIGGLVSSQLIRDRVAEVYGKPQALAKLSADVRSGAFQRDYQVSAQAVKLKNKPPLTVPIRDEQGFVTGLKYERVDMEQTIYNGQLAYSKEKQKAVDAAKKVEAAKKAPTKEAPPTRGRR